MDLFPFPPRSPAHRPLPSTIFNYNPDTSEITLLLFPSPITLFPEAPQPLYARKPRNRHLLEKRNHPRTLSLE